MKKVAPARVRQCVKTRLLWLSYHLACISCVMCSAVLNQAVLIEVLAVAVRAGECVAIRNWTVRVSDGTNVRVLWLSLRHTDA